jgi:opacity protein-like surface antigen
MILNLPLRAQADDGKNYFSLFYGFANSPRSEDSEETLKGSAVGAALGRRLDANLLLEAGIQKMSIEKENEVLSDGSGNLTATERSRSVILASAGVRLLFLRFLNLHGGLGLGWSKMREETSATSSTMNSPMAFSFFYGLGAQLPLGLLDLYGDFTLFSRISVTRTIDIGMRVRF